TLRAALALTTYAPPTTTQVRPATAARQAAPPAPVKSGSHNPCYDLPTPGERLICGFPVVAARQKRLQAAYDTAIAAGVPTAALAQSAWASKANRTWDRGQYMALMES